MSDFYADELDHEAFGHTGLRSGRPHLTGGKTTMAVIDEIVSRLPPFPESFRRTQEEREIKNAG